MPITTTTGQTPGTGASTGNSSSIGFNSAGWQLTLYESNLFNTDLHPVTGVATPGLHTRVATLTQARNRQFTPTLNRSKNFSFSIPLDHSEALLIVGYQIRRAVLFQTQNGYIWSGFIGTYSVDAASNTLNVTVMDWLEILNHREISSILNIVNGVPGAIANTLLTMANIQISNDPETNGDSPNRVKFSDSPSQDDIVFFSSTGAGSGTALAISFDSGWLSTLSAPSLGIQWSSSSGINRTTFFAVGDNIPVTPGTQYGLRAFFDFGTQNSTSSRGYIAVAAFTSSDTQISTSTPITQNGFTTSGPHRAIATYTPPAGTAYIKYLVGYLPVPASGFSAANMNMYGMALTYGAVSEAPTPIESGNLSFEYPLVRTRQYQIGQKIGQSIEELSNIEDGYDYQIRTSFDGALTSYRRYLDTYHNLVKSGTTIYGLGNDHPEIVMTYNYSENEELANIALTSDISKVANRMRVTGNSGTAVAQDSKSISNIGLWEDSATLSDTGLTDDILLAYAGAEVAYRGDPVAVYNPIPKPSTSAAFGIGGIAPNTFNVGDIIYIQANYGALQVGTVSPQPIRIFSMTLECDDEGNERITSMNTTASS